MTRWLQPPACALLLGGALFAWTARAAPPTPPPAADSTPPPAPAVEEAPEPEDPPPPATDAIARRILENFITVEGGAPALKQIALIQATGTEYSLVKNGVPHDFTYWIAPPSSARLDTVEQQKYSKVLEIHQAISGNVGWSIETSAKNPVVEDVPPAQLPVLTQLAAFVYPFLDYDARGLRYKYTGQEKFRGLSALVVEAWPAQGPPAFLYFDNQNFLLLRLRSATRIGTIRTWANIYITKYEKVGNFWFPAIWEYALSDAVISRTEVKEVQFLPKADPALFARPAEKEGIVLRQARSPGSATAAPPPPASP